MYIDRIFLSTLAILAISTLASGLPPLPRTCNDLPVASQIARTAQPSIESSPFSSRDVSVELLRRDDKDTVGHTWRDWPNHFDCQIPCYFEAFDSPTDIQGAGGYTWREYYIRNISSDAGAYTDVNNKKFVMNLSSKCGYDKIGGAQFRRAYGLNDWFVRIKDLLSEFCVIATINDYAPDDGCDHCYIIRDDRIFDWHKE